MQHDTTRPCRSLPLVVEEEAQRLADEERTRRETEEMAWWAEEQRVEAERATAKAQRLEEQRVSDEARLLRWNYAITALFVCGEISQAESERRLAEPLDSERVVEPEGDRDVEMAVPVLRMGDSVDALRASTVVLLM